MPQASVTAGVPGVLLSCQEALVVWALGGEGDKAEVFPQVQEVAGGTGVPTENQVARGGGLALDGSVEPRSRQLGQD